ncbi:MAG TPA: Hsp70 family protein [Solirubrobacteraceae bacterium]|nr:Hsp70 family protein [Solirubrobacteraceae bacterium]
MTTFGIDLGTTNSVISRLSEGRPTAIPVAGEVIVPSVVCFRDDGVVVVGREARNLELAHPDRTVRSAKRRIGQDFAYDVAGRRLRPEEVSAEVLRALKRGAEAVTGEAVREVVITVPAYFDDAQRRGTLRAGELAGLDVLRLLNEPTSASLVFDQAVASAARDPEIVLVYDLGGGTFDVSVLEVFGEVREVRATAGNTHLGGDDFDDKLLSLFLDLLRTQHGADVRDDPRAMARLRRLAEDTKIRLSTETEVAIAEEFIATAGGRPLHLQTRVTRRQLEALIRPLLESTVELARRAVSEANLGAQPLTRVCLVGGSTRIPLCREVLDDAFHVDVREDVDPDLAVGLGAAVQAGLLKGEPIERILVDVSAHSLGILAMGRHDAEEDDGRFTADTFVPIIRRNTVLPAVRSEELYTALDDQETIQVRVFQGESPQASKNTPVGTFKYDLEPVPEGSPVVFQLEYDLDGVVRVSVSQPETKNAKTVALRVADASGKPSDAADRESSAIVRKARAALARLEGERRSRLEGLLADLAATGSGERRTEIEDAILDLLLDADGDEAASSG